MKTEDATSKTFRETWAGSVRAVQAETSVPLVQTLTDAVLGAVRAIPEESLYRVAPQETGVAYQPRTLLALLTYCYANEIYASEDIEQRMGQDADFCRACAEEFPGALLLQRFRRANREALIRCLASVLAFQQEQESASGTTASLLDVTEGPLLDLARQRVQTAILLDLND